MAMLLFRPFQADASPPPQAAASRWWAVCEVAACRAAGPVDIGPWLGQGRGGPPLASLENRLRCICGARRARLTCAPPHGAAVLGPAPYLFV